MEDEEIKSLFRNFHPATTPSSLFMARLQKNMATVEMLRQHSAALRKRNTVAVAIAAATGFAMGVILTLLFPVILNAISTISISLPQLPIDNLSIGGEFMTWMLMAAVCVVTALNAYEIAIARLRACPIISVNAEAVSH